jgi:hypothetical protein
MGVAELKREVATEMGVPVDQQKLLIKGKPLIDTDRLSKYGSQPRAVGRWHPVLRDLHVHVTVLCWCAGVVDGSTLTLVGLKKKKKKREEAGAPADRGPKASAPPIADIRGGSTAATSVTSDRSQAAASDATRAKHASDARKSLGSAQAAMQEASLTGGRGAYNAPDAGDGSVPPVEHEMASILEALCASTISRPGGPVCRAGR